MTQIKKLFLLILCFIILIISTGCKKDYSKQYIYFELPKQPETVDAQTASSDSDLLIVKNIYEGLLRKNSSDAIVCGAAEDFTYNNLTYIFKLRKDAVWSNGDPITADDFVFGFQRAVLPETKSPFVSRLFNIVNAKKINSGKAGVESLGVKAVNENTFTITLETEDKGFEETLTSSVAMPCNRKFFTASEGKYGLTSETTLSNGSYRMAKWNKESFGIRLYKNEEYNGSLKALNSAIFLTCDEKEPAIEKLKKNSVDMAFIDSSISEQAKKDNIKIANTQNICWVMTFSNQFSYDMRKSFAMLIGNTVYKDSLKPGYSTASSLFPSSIIKEQTNVGIMQYDVEASKQLFNKELNKLQDNKFYSGVKLYYYDNDIIKPVITDIVGHWQKNLGAYVNIEKVSSPDLLVSQLKEQTYSISLFPIAADGTDISEYVSKFGIDYKGESPEQLQEKILKSNNIIPVLFQNTTIAYTSSLSSVIIDNGNGYIDFSFIIKTE